MLPVVLTVGPLAAAVANAFVLSATPVSGTALTLTGTQPDKPRRILLIYGVEGSARTLRITGTNADGNRIRETLAVPSGAGGTVATIQDFLTITEAMPLGGGWTQAMTLGTNGVASSPWKQTNYRNQGFSGLSFSGVASGTVTWGMEYTYDTINDNQDAVGSALGNDPTPPTPWTMGQITAQVGNAEAATDNPISAWRLVLLSGTGSVTGTVLEGGMTESS